MTLRRPGQNDDQTLVLPVSQQVGDVPWPSAGRLIGVDYGSVRIGLAICDPSRTFVSPVTTYRRRDARTDADFFARTAKAEAAAGWVVGLPIHCDGYESGKSRETRGFAAWLFQHTRLPVRFFDERYTSKLADQMLMQSDLTARKRKNRIDSVAALLILEHFLENERARIEHEAGRQ